MKAIPPLLFGLASLMGAELEPVSTIDFGPALHITHHHPHLPILYLSPTPNGALAAGGSATGDIGIARATRDGSQIQAFRLNIPVGGGGELAARPDGAIWFTTRWARPFSSVQPILGGGGAAWPRASRQPIGPPFIAGDPTAGASAPFQTDEYPTSYDLYAPDGRRLESFLTLNLATDIAASTGEVVIVTANLIRAGHVVNHNFVTDRDWRVNGPHLVFPLDHDRFAVVNRMSGELVIIDPSTPATRTITLPIRSASVRDRLPVTAADGSIWFLVRGASRSTGDLLQFAPDGSITSRTTLRVPAGFRPRKIAVSGRDVYVSGTTAIIYRYELL